MTKKSKLRNLAENSNNFACYICYHDTVDQIKQLLHQKLKEIKINTSREFVNSIFEINSFNRQDINDAIDKIILIKNSSILNEEKLKDLLSSSTNNNNFEIVNDCLLGNQKNINIFLNNIYAQGINFNEILSALKYKINKLLRLLLLKLHHPHLKNLQALIHII